MGVLRNAEDNGCNSALFLTGHPFDDEYPMEGRIPQRRAVGEFLKAQPFSDKGLEIVQTDHRDAVSIFEAGRANGVSADKLFCAQGFMIIPLGRRSVDGDSIVGCVDSFGGRLGLDGSSGNADPVDGVGLSARLE
jgi:hypothetical protein